MDQRTSDVEADLKQILQTRVALADKIQLLERRVEETVYTTKTAALDVISQARNTAVAWVESTADQLHPATQAARRPWVLVGGAVAIGIIAGWLDQRRKSAAVYDYAPGEADAAEVMPPDGRDRSPEGVYPFYGRSRPRAKRVTGRPRRQSESLSMQVRSLWEDFAGEFMQERERLHGAVLETGRTFLQAIAHSAVQSLVDSLKTRTFSAGPDHDTDVAVRPSRSNEEAPPTRTRAAA